MQIESVGPYRIEQHLGSGGMGTVYLAWDDRLKRKVAIKSIHPNKELSEERLERLRREAQAIASINHPSVTHVHDIITEDGRDYIVMEYVEGRSLTSVLTETPLPHHRAVNIARQIAAGLAAAHEKGVIHRDLKPENVMIDSSGNVKILDFGLAKSIAEDSEQVSLTEEGMVMGTSRAMSPEQAKGEHVDARSDLFSLGSIIYELITGKHPFQASNPLDTMHRIVKHRQPPPRRYQPEIPIELGLLVEKLLEKDRKKRPSSAKEIAIALDALAEGDSTKTSNLTTLDKLTAQARRRRNWRRFWPLGVAAVALIIAGFVTWLWFNSNQPVETTVVAVLKPVIDSDTEDPRGQTIIDAVRLAIVNTAASLDGLSVIDPRSIDSLGSDHSEVAKGVAADELLVPSCTPLGDTWRITTTALTQKGTVRGAEAIRVPSHNLSELSGAVETSIRKLYPTHESNNSRYISTATSDDWEEYLRISREIRTGTDFVAAYQDLERLRARSPKFLEPALRETAVARYLFESTKNESYLEKGRAALQDARALAPDDPRTLLETADLAFATGDYETVERAISAGRRSAPTEDWIPQYEARLLDIRGDRKEARKILVDLCARRRSWRSLFLLAQHDNRDGSPESALTILGEALQLAPSHPSIRMLIAKIELSHGDLNRAEEILTGLANDYPGPYYLEDLGWAQMLLGQYAEAESTFRTLLDLNPSHAMTMLNLADCMAFQGDSESAKEFYQKALQAANASPRTDSPEVLTVRAQCLAHLGQSSEAVSVIMKRLEVTPNDRYGHFDAALVYTVIGQHTVALVSARRAIEAGIVPRWFEIPWFSPLRDLAEFHEILAENDSRS